MEKKLNLNNFYDWYQRLITNRYKPDKLYKVVLKSGAFFALAFFGELKLKQVNNSQLVHKDLVVWRNKSPYLLHHTYTDILYDDLDLVELEYSDINRICQAIKFINTEINKHNYSAKYYLPVVNKYIEALENLQYQHNVDSFLKFCEENVVK